MTNKRSSGMNITEDDLLEVASIFSKGTGNYKSKVVGHCLYFYARRSPDGTCLFSFRYRCKSNKKQKEHNQTIGHYPDMTLEEARREASKIDKLRQNDGQRLRHLKAEGHEDTKAKEQPLPQKNNQPDYLFETPFGSVSIKCPNPDDLPRLLKSLATFGGSFNG